MIDLEQFETPKPEVVKGQANDEPGSIWILLTENQAEAVSSGYVPRSVKSALREMLDCDLEDQRRAERPTPKRENRKPEPASCSEMDHAVIAAETRRTRCPKCRERIR